MQNHGMTALICATSALFAATSSQAQSVEEFYRGKQIEFVSGGDAGTSYDKWARLISEYLPKYIPGSPTFIVKAMPGAGHIRATNYLYSVAPKDGTTIGMISQLIPTASVLKNKSGLEADFTKFSFMGSPDQTNQVCVVRGDAKVQKGEELFSTELTVGGAGAGSGISAIPTFLRDVLGMKFNIVEGYKSSQEVMLAIERREIDGMCQTYQGVMTSRPKALADGSLKLLFNVEEKPIAGTGAPSIHSLIKDKEQKEIITFYSLNAEIGRPIIIPPGTPRDRVDALRKGYEAMAKDKAFLDVATKQNLDPSPLTGAEMDEKFRRILATPPNIIERAAKFM
jgi:tripartite-type tricarboxylate transporter receptor subunit TctC